MEKLDHIEEMLKEINSKIDNFLGFEEIKNGHYETYENTFCD